MFSHSFGTAGFKYKKNPVYDTQKIKFMQLSDIPKGVTPEELIEPDFIGKLAIAYQKDNIGRSAGNATWCKIYDCNCGHLTYMGTAIHKCVDPEYPEQNYNEKLYSLFGNLVFNNNIRIPDIDLVQDPDFPDKPAILSYNITHRENIPGQNKEEMTNMQTVALSIIERQSLKYDRVTLSTILDSIKLTVERHVVNDKKIIKKKIDDCILKSKSAKQLGDYSNVMTSDQEQLASIIKNQIDSIDESTTLESFLANLTTIVGRTVTKEEVSNIMINGTSILDILHRIKTLITKKNQNYSELEKSIVQVTVVDIMTNNIDRHLNNWALIMDKETGRYILGLFDHATSFFNMSLRNDYLALSQKDLKEHWATSSVLRDSPEDIKRVSSNGFDLFKDLLTNYREYVIEVLQKIHDSLPQFEQLIGYESISNADFNNLSAEDRKKYYQSYNEIVIPTKKVMDGFNMKFERIKQNFGLDFKNLCQEQFSRND